MTTKTARRRLVGGFALSVLAGAIASCGGTVRDSLGDSDPNAGGATSIPTHGTGSGGGSKATGAGGKTSSSGTVGAGAVTGTAGKSTGPGSGGKSGGGGTVGIGGKAGGAGTIAVGGKAGTGAVPAAGGALADPCAGVRCQNPLCPVGTPLYVAPGQCCPVCGPNCVGAGADCVFPICGPNEIAKTPPDGCCPTCYPVASGDAGASCDKAGYTMLRKELEQKYSTALCTRDSDCVAAILNFCERPDCGIALSQGAYQSFQDNLVTYADAHCFGCAPTQDGTCPSTPASARCLNGACALVRQ